MVNNKLSFDGNAYRIELSSGVVYEGSTTNLIAHFAVDTITICDRATKLHIPIMSSRANILEINGEVKTFEQAQTTIEDALSSAGGASSADKVSYDNTTSGLQSTTVQGAIDEVGANLGELSPKVNSLMDRADLVSVQAENVGYKGSNVGAELDAKNRLLNTFFNVENKSTQEKEEFNYDVTPISGYISIYGVEKASTSYEHFAPISVQEGDIVTLRDSIGVVVTGRFITAYNSQGSAVSASGKDGAYIKYIVPSGITSVVFSASVGNVKTINVRRVGSVITEEVYAPKDKTIDIDMLSDNVGLVFQKNDTSLIGRKDTLSEGESIDLGSCDVKNNKEEVFLCYFSGQFGRIEVGHGRKTLSSSMTGRVLVDNTTLRIGIGQEETPSKVIEEEHGLTITNYLRVSIKCENKSSVIVSLESMGQTFTKKHTIWYGCEYGIYATAIQGNYTDCVLSWTCDGFYSNIHIYGDSYLSNIDTARWGSYLFNDEYGEKILLSGYSGRRSAYAYADLVTILNHCKTKPQYILWTMGMNDIDNADSINEMFKLYLDSLIEICEKYGITPILSTIPNVPQRNHTFKNAYIKSLGYRYVDFAKAVNAESVGATWYDGMLNNDNVHPTELGAKALYSRVLADFPEIMQK